MGLFSFFKSGNYFDKNMTPKCDYCRFGKRAKDGNKVICEHRGLVDTTYSCSKFVYSPLKRIPVKQLNFVGSLADEDLYSESVGDRVEKEEKEKAEEAAAKKVKKQQDEPKKKPVEEEPVSAAPAPEKDEPQDSLKSAKDNADTEEKSPADDGKLPEKEAPAADEASAPAEEAKSDSDEKNS